MKKNKFMYMIFFVVIMILTFYNNNETKSYEKNDITIDNKIEKNKISYINSYGNELYNYSTDSISEFTSWIKNIESRESNNGAFKKLVKLYSEECKRITIPLVKGENATKIFVDSNKNTINYIFKEPSIRICIEPIEIEENNKYRKGDVSKFMVDKYGISLNKKEEIDNIKIRNNTGYEYNKVLYKCSYIKLGKRNKKCIVGKMFSEKSSMQHIINFIEDDVLVRIIYFDENKELDLEEIKKLSFEKILLN